MTDLAEKLRDLPARRGDAPWPDHEYVKGWGVMGLPFDSGHHLALRVFPENDFSPYKTVCASTVVDLDVMVHLGPDLVRQRPGARRVASPCCGNGAAADARATTICSTTLGSASASP